MYIHIWHEYFNTNTFPLLEYSIFIGLMTELNVMVFMHCCTDLLCQLDQFILASSIWTKSTNNRKKIVLKRLKDMDEQQQWQFKYLNLNYIYNIWFGFTIESSFYCYIKPRLEVLFDILITHGSRHER